MERESKERRRAEGQEADRRRASPAAAGPEQEQGRQVEEPRQRPSGEEEASAPLERREGLEMAVPEGGAPAGPERAERRYRERSVKRKVKDAESPDDKWTFPLERKAKVPIQKASEESEESGDSGPEKPELPKQARLPLPRPRIRFSFAPRLSRRWSQWSATDTRPRDSVINELAKMGDPDLLEMVEQEGRRNSREFIYSVETSDQRERNAAIRMGYQHGRDLMSSESGGGENFIDTSGDRNSWSPSKE
ncbi:Hypothetical predicted protein, partial [Marmota monax]